MRAGRPVILSDYWIYKHPVAVAQCHAFCKATGRFMPDSPAHVYEWPGKWTDRHPVTYVADAAAYGGPLPADEEWEKAARGVDGRLFPWGDDFDRARFHSTMKGHPRHRATPCPIGLYPQSASPFGMEDCCANVAEWTSTKCSDDRQVLRGSTMHNLRGEYHLVTARAHARTGDCLNLVGFRVVLR